MDNNPSLTGISAVCFDAFCTLIEYGGPRLNPYRRLLERTPDKQTGRLSFLTRDVGVEVFAREWGLEDELPAIQRELSQELAGLGLYSEVGDTLHMLQRAGKKGGGVFELGSRLWADSAETTAGTRCACAEL